MIKTIVQKEFLENLLSFRFFITLILCIILIPLGIYVSTKEYENSQQDYQQSLSLYRESMQGMRNAIDIDARGLRPPSPFSIFAGGLEKSLPNEIISSRNEGLQLENNRSFDDPLATLFGKMDFLFIVSVVLSLLAILFTFDAITRESEQGTLRLSISNSLPRHHILIGKYLGHFITFLIPYLMALLIGILFLSLSGAIALFHGDNPIRLLAIIFVSIIFISVFFNLGLMVSTLTKRSLTAQISLLFIWVLLIFAWPRVSHMIARIINPVKTQQTVNLEKALVRKNIDDEKASRLKDAFIKRGQINSEGEGPTYDELRAPIVAELKEKEQQQLDAIDQDQKARNSKQLKIASLLSRLSPLSSLTFALTELSDTGIQDMENLYDQARKFHNAVTETVHSQGYKDDIPGMGMRMAMGYINMETVPQFTMNRISLTQGLQAIWVDVLLLIIFNLLFFSIAYVGFLRYDVR